MNDFISFNKTYFDTSTSIAKKAADYMKNVVNNSGAALSSVPSDFADRASAIGAINGLKETCIYSDNLGADYNNWGLLMDKINTDPDNVYLFDFGDGAKYVAFDNTFMVFVTQGSESGSDGVGYPLDQYVMGVVDGEGEAQKWGRECYDGEITTTQYMNMVKAFSVMARSYGIAQTYYNSNYGHNYDHKIQSGSTKQCFNTRLFEDTNMYPGGWSLYSTTTLAGVLETSFIAYGNDERILPLYYNNGDGQVAKIHDLAIQGKDWVSILKEVYPTEFEEGGLKYFDVVPDESMPGGVRIDLLGDVPDDTEVSKYIEKNLSDDQKVYTSQANPDNGYKTTWTYKLEDGKRVVTVDTESEKGYSNDILFDESTLKVETQSSGNNGLKTDVPTGSDENTDTNGSSLAGGNINGNGTTNNNQSDGLGAGNFVNNQNSDPVNNVGEEENSTTPNGLSGSISGKPTDSGNANNPPKDTNGSGVLGGSVDGKKTDTSTTTQDDKDKDGYNKLSDKIDAIEDKLNNPEKEEPVEEPVKEEPKEEPYVPPKDDPKPPKDDPKPPVDPKPPTDPKPSVNPEPTYILPENKFSEILPNITSGTLDSMEISVEHVNYELSGITDEVYNNYINSIKTEGYTLGADGIWINGNYTLNIVRNNTDLNIYFKSN